jgi:acylphosphatase
VIEGKDTVRARARVSGRVQGVWFRQSTAERAAELGVAGWVRNVGDGSVEALFEGPPGAVEGALEFVRTGPPRADVTGVEVTWEDPEGVVGFTVRS